MRLKTRYFWTILMLLFVPCAQAQVQVDLSKITCQQFVHHKVAHPRQIAAWVSGFYNGKRDNSIIDVQKFQANLNKIERFCKDDKNFDVMLLKAVEQVIETSK